MLKQKLPLTMIITLSITTLAALPTLAIPTTTTSILHNQTPVAQTYDLTVPDDFPTIQEAIDHASNGGTIYVRPGTYYENIIVDVQGLHIKGDNPAATIIDGSGNGDVITLNSPFYEKPIISGFTIRNSGPGNNGVLIENTGIIKENIITHNGCGVKISEESVIGGEIYGNNFVDNEVNAYDTYVGTWNNIHTRKGNYWDDYTGTDLDGDGIGEDPYDIGRSHDFFPLMLPIKWNLPPEKPIISGPSTGEPNHLYTYTIMASDPNNNNVRFEIDWGDGHTTTTELCASGEATYVTHQWNESGTYIVRAKTIDTNDAESETTILSVSMPKNKSFHSLLYKILNRLFPQNPLFLSFL